MLKLRTNTTASYELKWSGLASKAGDHLLPMMSIMTNDAQ